jgi:hypothetical protein
MSQPELISAVVPVVNALEGCSIRYYLGGSLASSVHGVPRASIDADLIADFPEDKIGPFVDALSDTYYVEGESIRAAIGERSSFNLIHLATMMKIDVFILKESSYDRTSFERATGAGPVVSLGGNDFVVATAEDTILHKLLWYRKGGEVSERQWTDVTGILSSQGSSLDMDYLGKWAKEIGVSDLLEKILEEASS